MFKGVNFMDSRQLTHGHGFTHVFVGVKIRN